MAIPQGKDQWFAVQVLSGQEQKVHDNMIKRIKTEEMSDLIYEVLVPTERVSEIKRGKKTETTRKLMPGYVIVNMHLLDDNNQLVDRTWYFIRETPGVLGFAGTKDSPVPMPSMRSIPSSPKSEGADEKVKPKVSFRSRRDRQGRRRPLPEPERRRRGDRPRARQAPRLRQHLRPRSPRRSRVLAGRARLGRTGK